MKTDCEKPVLLIGIGNIDRGDDGAGISVARHIRARVLPDIVVIEHTGMGADLMDLWQTIPSRIVYLIDAMSSLHPIGAIQRFEAHNAPLPAQFTREYSTHGFGLAQAIELSRVFGSLPAQLIVFGIEGKCFDLGTPLSAAVATAVLKTAELIVAEIFPFGSKRTTLMV